MKVAIIPPRGYENHALVSDYQLLLPQELEREAYARIYLKAKERGDFLILDNGAAEGQATGLADLIAIGARFGVDEIVIPDVLGDAVQTCKQARWAEGSIQSCREYPLRWNESVQFVAVIQGENWIDAVSCLEAFAGMDHVDKIMVPRHLGNKLGMTFRIDFVEKNFDLIHERFGPVHCLGSTDYWREPCLLSDHPLVRGIDTSLIHGASLSGFEFSHVESDDRPKYTRPYTFFSAVQPMYSLARKRLERNFNCYGFWASNEELQVAEGTFDDPAYRRR